MKGIIFLCNPVLVVLWVCVPTGTIGLIVALMVDLPAAEQMMCLFVSLVDLACAPLVPTLAVVNAGPRL